MSRRYRRVSESRVMRLTLSSAPRCSNRLMVKMILVYIVAFMLLMYLNASSFVRITYKDIEIMNRGLSGVLRSVMMPFSHGISTCPNATVTPIHKPTILMWTADNYTDRFFRKTDSDSTAYITFKGGKQGELTFRKKTLYVASKCPTSIPRRMANNTRGITIYHPELHILMNSNLFNRPEHKRLSPFYMPFGYKQKGTFGYKDVLSSLKLFPVKSSIFEFSENNSRPECLSCAVVCNGGILNGSSKGQEIDNHHMVFRVNKAVRRNHERDVGNRTTHYFFFDRSLRNTSAKDVPKDRGLIYVFVPCRENDYKYIISVVQGKEPKIKAAAKDVRILHPDFIRYLMKIWVNTPQKSFRPTTGTLMLLTALHSGCDQVSVYGMGYNDKYTLYYFDEKYRRFRMDPHSHDIKSELAILMGLDRAGIISWYKRDVAKFYTHKEVNSTL